MLTSYFVLKLQPQLIRFWGYDCEVHSVQTRDGYKLEIHRIPRGKDEKPLGYGKTYQYCTRRVFILTSEAT